KIKTYEATVRLAPARRWSVHASYFFSILQDVIEIRPNDGSIPIGVASQHETFSQNVEATHMFGGTFGFTYRLGRRVYVYADYTVTADRDSQTPLDVQTDGRGNVTALAMRMDGHEIDNIAMRKGNFGINYLL